MAAYIVKEKKVTPPDIRNLLKYKMIYTTSAPTPSPLLSPLPSFFSFWRKELQWLQLFLSLWALGIIAILLTYKYIYSERRGKTEGKNGEEAEGISSPF